MTQRSNSSIAIDISKVMLEKKHFEVTVALRNDTCSPVHVLDFDSYDGCRCLIFYLKDPSGAQIPIIRRNVRHEGSSMPLRGILMEPGSVHEWSFDFLDGTWIIPNQVGSGEAQLLIAEINIPTFQGCYFWHGRSVSKEYILDKPVSHSYPLFGSY